MPRPRSLTPEGIAAAALAVLDREGHAGLTMRAVAGELGMSTMALYRYVADRDHLETLVVDLVLGGIDLTVSPRASWRTNVRNLLTRTCDAVHAHPSVTPLLLTQRHGAPASQRWGETLLGLLDDAGFRGKRRVIAFRTLLSYLFGALQTNLLGPLAGPGTAAIAALPAADFPLLADTAGRAAGISAEDEFRHGLDIILTGLTPPPR